MPRLPRVVLPNIPHHVLQRGTRKQKTFFRASDYRGYLRLLQENCAFNNVEIWAYCLMPNHVHLILTPTRLEGLSAGRIVQTGTPDEMYTRPGDTYVAAMVGSPKVNLISAVRRGEDARPSVELPFASVSGGPWSEALKAFPVGSELIFGIRPNDVVANSADAGDAEFTAKVHLTEPLGDVVILDLEVGGTGLKMVLPEEQAVRYSVGDDVPVSLRVENTHVFARETGSAIR